MKWSHLLTGIAISLLTYNFGFAQEDDSYSLFEAGIIAGINVSQVDGDDLAGYRKVGFNGGGTAWIRFHPKLSVGFEIIYSQKGSKSSPNELPPEEAFKLKLDYIEVPLMFNFHDKNRAIFSAGMGYGRLIRFEETRGGIEAFYPENPYSKSELSAIAMVTFMFQEHFGVNLRWSYSIKKLGTFEGSNFKNLGRYNNVLSVRTMYVF